jgi:beta-glucosidase
VAIEAIDQSCLRVLRLVRQARAGEDRSARFDEAAHHELARQIAAQSLVLLRNRDHTLPLDPAARQTLLVVGQARCSR